MPLDWSQEDLSTPPDNWFAGGVLGMRVLGGRGVLTDYRVQGGQRARGATLLAVGDAKSYQTVGNGWC